MSKKQMTFPGLRRRVTVSEVREALRAVVRDHPGSRDQRSTDGLPARYVANSAPCCLVALVLARLGFSLGVLRALDHEMPTGELLRTGVAIADSRHPALRKIDPLARQLLHHVQRLQDAGQRWDRIVEEALAPTPWLTVNADRRRKPWLYQTRVPVAG